MKKIGLLGCGTIGTQIALAIDSGAIPARLTHVFDSSENAAAALVSKLKTRPKIVKNAHLLSSHQVDIVVEAASQDAVRDSALSILQNRRDLMIMSAGALLDDAILDVLSDACRDYNRTIYLPTGAVAGLDAIKAVRGELESLSITTTKHPRSLRGAKFFDSSDIDPDAIDSPTILFEGTAAEAVSLFPANINVAALLSLSGIGSQDTRVKIVADPKTSTNTHRIDASGRFGKMAITVENLPDPANPKTSRLAVLSAIETLRQYCSVGVRLGT
ncbi:MAG: aspartate dehydrogenase [Nitrosopumilus sp. H13]|nr:MAG: aspartate dehydrogenase [Nitrosopumilus sp. H13]